MTAGSATRCLESFEVDDARGLVAIALVGAIFALVVPGGLVLGWFGLSVRDIPALGELLPSELMMRVLLAVSALLVYGVIFRGSVDRIDVGSGGRGLFRAPVGALVVEPRQRLSVNRLLRTAVASRDREAAFLSPGIRGIERRFELVEE